MSSVVSSGETGQSQESKDNFNFVQLSRSYLKQLRNLARKSPIAHEILYYLVEHMGKTTNAVICSYATLCEITGVSRPTVGRAIKLLKDDNWIDTVKVGNANAYCVNEKVFWQAGRNQRKYAIFSATVIEGETKVKLHTYSRIKTLTGERGVNYSGPDTPPPPHATACDVCVAAGRG